MTSQIVKVPEKISSIFSEDATIREFQSILHDGTNSFIKSALIAIASSTELMACSPNSLANGALRSAALGLSLDPALRQAWLVPRKGVACFQPHYAGLYDLAVRTNLYRYISVMPIHKGERIVQDPQSGLHHWHREGSKVIFAAVQGEGGLKVDNMRDVTDGSPTAPVIGYLGYFKTRHGYEKSIWMTLAEIQAHALKWSPASYNSKNGTWQNPKTRPIMEMKTVFIALSKFMDLSGRESAKLKDALESDVTVEQPAEEVEILEIEAEAVEEEPAEEAQPATQKVERPIAAESLRSLMAKKVKNHANKGTNTTALDGQILASMLDTTFGGDKDKRYTLCKWLVGTASTKDMTPAQIAALQDWMECHEFSDVPPQYVITEANNAYTAALKDAGQMEML